MIWIHRCMVVPAAHVATARTIASTLAGPSGSGMWITALNSTGTGAATHYISSGKIEDLFAYLLTDASILLQACQDAGLSYTLPQLSALLTASDVSEEDPFTALSRLNLRIINA